MFLQFGTGQRDFYQSPIPISQRNIWEVFFVHQGRFGLVFPNQAPIYNTAPTAWVLGPDLFHGKVGDGSLCEVAKFSCPKMHPWIEQICPRDQYLKLEFSPSESPHLLECIQQARTVVRSQDPLTPLREEMSFLKLSLLLLEKIPKLQLPSVQPHEEKRLQSAFLWFEEHMELNPDLNQVALSIHLSESHFRRLVREHFKKSAHEIIQDLKMTKAKGLLAMDYTIDQISTACGYGSSPAFSRAFKKRMGLSPLAFRQNPR